MNAPLLHITGLRKRFPGVTALDDVGLSIHPGEILALVGENGAGKSTLIKILAGAEQPDEGVVSIAGEARSFRSPWEARRAGIAVIHQELHLAPTLNAADNIFLGQELSRFGWVRHGEQQRRAQDLVAQLGVAVPVDALCRDLSIAQQQVVEIARALVTKARLLVLDEPSATLTPQEVARLFAILRQLRAQGMGILYVSHRLEEIFLLADRVMVLRDGRHVHTCAVAEVNQRRLVEFMVGRQITQEYPPRHPQIGPPRLVVRGLGRRPRVRGVSLTLHRGEILGLTGLVGSGRTETARLLFGADRAEQGAIELDGLPLRLRSPRDAIAAGIALLTEDRKNQGLVLGRSVSDNFALASWHIFSRFGLVNEAALHTALAQQIAQLRIKLSDPGQPVAQLSGGNQQKVVLARWLFTQARILIFDEPTRGIDVGARYEIYQLLDQLAAQGRSILLITSELPEALGVCDRILVMHQGRLAGEITDVAHASQEDILRLAVG